MGIDVEYLRPIEAATLARRFFMPREYNWLTSQPVEQWQAAFFRLWTAKESVLKATGEGLAALSHLEIGVAGDRHCSPVLRLDKPLSDQSEEWMLHSFTPSANYVAALATAPSVVGVRYFRLLLNSLQ
ncbi:MAG: 4'-phosphopantetheinyl transferase superfamily protein [Leptolyngbyaceae cyanobacterium SL_7_1]|nr:4'-phosphopantetheinyl transferase superfamily protein [Leptolyngbyaceae cyanobacterium SL_7_1]